MVVPVLDERLDALARKSLVVALAAVARVGHQGRRQPAELGAAALQAGHGAGGVAGAQVRGGVQSPRSSDPC